MTDPTEQLADWQAKTDAATDGPWWGDPEWFGDDYSPIRNSDGFVTGGFNGVEEPDLLLADAEFIATARTAMPKLLAAVQAVRALHRPVPVYALADECGRDPDVHEVMEDGSGDLLCLGSPTGDLVCEECAADDSGEWRPYPCPTVRAIEDALGGEQ